MNWKAEHCSAERFPWPASVPAPVHLKIAAARSSSSSSSSALEGFSLPRQSKPVSCLCLYPPPVIRFWPTDSTEKLLLVWGPIPLDILKDSFLNGLHQMMRTPLFGDVEPVWYNVRLAFIVRSASRDKRLASPDICFIIISCAAGTRGWSTWLQACLASSLVPTALKLRNPQPPAFADQTSRSGSDPDFCDRGGIAHSSS